MASIQITIPDAAVQRVLNAINGLGGNQPATQAAAIVFARQALYNDIRAKVLTWEAMQADAAKAADQTDPLANVVQS